MTDWDAFAEASVLHRSPRDIDVETMLHQLRREYGDVAKALADENIGAPTERYLAVTKRAWAARP